MKRALIFISICITALYAYSEKPFTADQFKKYFQILPAPQQIGLIAGPSMAYDEFSAVYLKGFSKRPVMTAALDCLPLRNTSGKHILTLSLSVDNGIPESPEGYILQIKNHEVIISSRGVAGLFYGCQTLSQLMEDARDQHIRIPSCRIVDFPDLAYRSVLIVLAHHLSTVKYYYDLIDRLAQVKINAIILQFEDKLRFRRAPVVGSENAVSIDEFIALSRYAKERYIEISPLVQGLGHAGYILKHDEYKSLREDPSSDLDFSPLDSGTYRILFALYEDAIDATPNGKYLHVGGDEVSNLGTSALSKSSGMKPFELQMYWLNKVCDFAVKHNRIPIFWDDMVFKLAGTGLFYTMMHDTSISKAKIIEAWNENESKLDENIGLFPRQCIYMRWNYKHAEILGNIKAIDWYKRHHLKSMAATAATSYPEVLLPRSNSNVSAIKTFSQIAGQKKMDGITCAVWDDRSPHFETMWRGLYALALFSWKGADMPGNEYNALFRHRFYGPALGDSAFEIQDGLEELANVWDTILVDKSRRSSYPKNIDLINLPSDQAGSWSSSYATRVNTAKAAEAKYNTIRSRIANCIELSTRNRYCLQVLNQINELEEYSTHLILLLDSYDRGSNDQDRKAAKEKIDQYVNAGFANLRSAYEEVFSETRFLSNPEGYRLDQIHHLANGTVNDDWMFVFELAMNRKINSWLQSLR